MRRSKTKRNHKKRKTRKQRGGAGNGVEGFAFWLLDNLPKRSASSTTDIGLMPYSLTEIREVVRKILIVLETKGIKKEKIGDIERHFDELFALPTKKQSGGGPDNGEYGPGPGPEPLSPLEGWITLILVLSFMVSVLRRYECLEMFNVYVIGNISVISSAVSIVVRITNGEPLIAHGFTCLAMGTALANLHNNGAFVIIVYEIRDLLTYFGFFGGAAEPIALLANRWWMMDLAVQEIPLIRVRINQIREYGEEIRIQNRGLYDFLMMIFYNWEFLR